MATGIRTTNIETRVALSDEIIVNKDGQTGVQSVDDFAAQMAQSGRFGALNRDVLFSTIKSHGNGALHFTLEENYSYIEDDVSPDLIVNGVYLRVLGDEISTKHLGATANGTYIAVSEEMVALHDWLSAGDAWDFFALEWMLRVPAGDTRQMIVSRGEHVVNRSVGGALVESGGKSHLGNLVGTPKSSKISAYAGGSWPPGNKVVDLSDNGDNLTRRTIVGVIFDANNVTGGLDTSYTKSSGAGAGHYFEDVKVINAVAGEVGWLADNNDEATTVRCSANHTEVNGIAYQCLAPGGPIYLDGLWVSCGRVRISAQNFTSTSSLMGGISVAAGPTVITLLGGQIGQSIYNIDGTNYAICIHLEAGSEVMMTKIVGTYCLYEQTSNDVDGYLFGGEGSFVVRRAVSVEDAAVHVPSVYADSGFNGKLFMNSIGSSVLGGNPVIARFDGVRFKNIDVLDASNVRISQGLNTSVFSSGINTVNVRNEAVVAGGGIQLHPGDGAHIIALLAQIIGIDDISSHYLASMVGGNLVLASRKSGDTGVEIWSSLGGIRQKVVEFGPAGNILLGTDGAGISIKQPNGVAKTIALDDSGRLTVGGVVVGTQT